MQPICSLGSSTSLCCTTTKKSLRRLKKWNTNLKAINCTSWPWKTPFQRPPAKRECSLVKLVNSRLCVTIHKKRGAYENILSGNPKPRNATAARAQQSVAAIHLQHARDILSRHPRWKSQVGHARIDQIRTYGPPDPSCTGSSARDQHTTVVTAKTQVSACFNKNLCPTADLLK